MHEAFEAEHVARQSRRPLLIVSLLFWLKDMDGLFAYTVNSLRLLIPQILESHLFCKPYRLSQENIDLNVLSVTITDMTCAPANCHYQTNL